MCVILSLNKIGPVVLVLLGSDGWTGF